jgi:hypothetical protein
MKKTMMGVGLGMAALASAYAGEVYVGAGFPGYTVGYAQTLSDALGLRGEYTGGKTFTGDGNSDGIDYSARFKSQIVGGFADWHPFNGGFRVAAGVTLNDSKFHVTATGNNTRATINGKTVNLTGERYDVDLTYPKVTPYLGVGYGFKPQGGTGWGFYTDFGVTFGRYKTEVSTTVVNRFGITQADVDAESASLRDSVNQASVFPKFSIGLTYRF